MTTPWLSAFRAAMDQSEAARGGAGANRMQVATVSPEGLPSIRSVYLRGLSDDGTVWFFTDSRTEKVAELKASGQVALHTWWDVTREQFRLTGRAAVHGAHAEGPFAKLREEFWGQLPLAERGDFAGPPPGRALGPPPLSVVPAPVAPPEFAVVAVDVALVDWLRLGPPRRRVLFRRLGTEWIEEEVGP